MTAGLARKLSRTKSHRDALLKNLVCELFQHGTITSTHPKCKEAARLAERIITWAKKSHNSPQYLPQIQSQLFLSGDNSKLLHKLVNGIGPRYQNRPGGYTRVLHLEPRLGDRSPQSVLELVDTPVVSTQTSNGEIQWQRGNLKLWLLVKNAIQDESLHDNKYNPLTVKNLSKMTLLRSREDLKKDILLIRRELQQDDTLQLETLTDTLLDAAYQFKAVKSMLHSTKPKNYQLMAKRP